MSRLNSDCGVQLEIIMIMLTSSRHRVHCSFPQFGYALSYESPCPTQRRVSFIWPCERIKRQASGRILYFLFIAGHQAYWGLVDTMTAIHSIGVRTCYFFSFKLRNTLVLFSCHYREKFPIAKRHLDRDTRISDAVIRAKSQGLKLSCLNGSSSAIVTLYPQYCFRHIRTRVQTSEHIFVSNSE